MNTMKTTLLGACLLALALPALPAHASNYPPDYPICSVDDFVTTGPFELIKRTVDPYDEHARLTVAYRGYLRDLYADHEINLWVRLNGNDVFVPANAGSHDDAYALFDSGPRACVWCGPNMPYPSAGCEDVVLPPQSSGVWSCQEPTATEQHLFFWAFDQWGNQNAWDIEVAAEAGGQWDSNWGANYYGRFEPRNSCW